MYVHVQKKFIPSRVIGKPLQDSPLAFGEGAAQDTVSLPPALVPIPTSPWPLRASGGMASGFADEFERAQAIVRESRQIMSRLFDNVRLGKPVETEALAPLVGDIAGSIVRNRSALVSLLRLKARDEYTYMHSVAVAGLMIGLGHELGFDERTLYDAGMAGLLHDIGKTAVPPQILGKPDSLTREEFDIIRTHPERGFDLLRGDDNIPALALDVCLHHHERYDGTGYPGNLAGNAISLFARMGAICDVYDAVTSNRPYKAPWNPAESLARMFSWEGHFDRDILAAFIRSIGIYPVGTLMRLQSDRLAVVTDLHGPDLTRPVVRAFMACAGRRLIAPVEVDLLAADDALITVEKPRAWGFHNWEEQWRSIACLRIV